MQTRKILAGELKQWHRPVVFIRKPDSDVYTKRWLKIKSIEEEAWGWKVTCYPYRKGAGETKMTLFPDDTVTVVVFPKKKDPEVINKGMV